MEQVLKTESPSPRCRCHASLCNGSNPKYSNCVYKAEFAVFTFKEKGNKAGARLKLRYWLKSAKEAAGLAFKEKRECAINNWQ